MLLALTNGKNENNCASKDSLGFDEKEVSTQGILLDCLQVFPKNFNKHMFWISLKYLVTIIETVHDDHVTLKSAITPKRLRREY